MPFARTSNPVARPVQGRRRACVVNTRAAVLRDGLLRLYAICGPCVFPRLSRRRRAGLLDPQRSCLRRWSWSETRTAAFPSTEDRPSLLPHWRFDYRTGACRGCPRTWSRHAKETCAAAQGKGTAGPGALLYEHPEGGAEQATQAKHHFLRYPTVHAVANGFLLPISEKEAAQVKERRICRIATPSRAQESEGKCTQCRTASWCGCDGYADLCASALADPRIIASFPHCLLPTRIRPTFICKNNQTSKQPTKLLLSDQ